MKQRNAYFLPIDEQIEPYYQEIPKKNIKELKFGTQKYEVHIGKKEEKLGLKKGKYVCLQAKQAFVYLNSAKTFLSQELSKVIKAFLKEMKIANKPLVMVVGLGNSEVVADSLGNRVTNMLIATELLPLKLKSELGNLCYLNCGVGGKTGISSSDVLMGVVKRIKPDVIVMVDALSTTKLTKLGCSFQVSNVSLIPGAGVNNFQSGFLENNIYNVISIGVPLLICGKGLGKVKKEVENMFFAPKEVDFYVKRCAEVISDAINKSVHKSGYQKYF